MTARIRHMRGARDQGFTLIELLVVVIIIGILAAIAVPVYLNQRKKAAVAQLKTDAHNLAIAYESWGAGNPGQPYPDVTVDWGSTNGMLATLGGTTSPGTRIHAFDLGSYYPATGAKPSQAYCIEIAHATANVPMYFLSSLHGKLSTTVCQSQ